MLSVDDGVHLDRGDVPVTVVSRQTAQVDVALTAGATITTTLTDRVTDGPAEGLRAAGRLYYVTPGGHTGWLGGTDLATASTYRVRNGATTTATVTIPV